MDNFKAKNSLAFFFFKFVYQIILCDASQIAATFQYQLLQFFISWVLSDLTGIGIWRGFALWSTIIPAR